MQTAQSLTTTKNDRSIGGDSMPYTNAEIPISFILNARGRMCLIHSKPFIGTPVWLKYMINKRKVKIIFDNGTEHVIDYVADDKLHKLLLNMSKLFMIRIEDGRPVEGFDTNLLKE